MTQVFKKIGSTLTLSQEVERQVENAIRSRKFKVGEKLPTEKELCEMFGVSRTSVREAIQMLSTKGLITIRKGSGIYVNDFSTTHASKSLQFFLEMNFDKQYVLHLIHVRQTIEPPMAKLAAKNRTDADIRDFEDNLQQFEKCKNDFSKIARLDLQFHLKIAEATGNPIYSLIMEPLYRMLPKIKTLIVKNVKNKNLYTALDYHRNIFEHIKSQNEQGAFDAMTAHLHVAERDANMLIEILKDDEKLF